MRRFAIIALTIVCLTCSLVGVNETMKKIRYTGLDFWNYFAESNRLECESEKSRDLDCELEVLNQWSQSTNSVAISLCNGQITINDAIDSVRTLLANSPYKGADLRTCYITSGYLRADAAERDTSACFLLLAIKSLQRGAEQTGDKTSAAFFSEHLIPIFKEAKAQSQCLSPTILDPM
jgi:hypothetical protein